MGQIWKIRIFQPIHPPIDRNVSSTHAQHQILCIYITQTGDNDSYAPLANRIRIIPHDLLPFPGLTWRTEATHLDDSAAGIEGMDRWVGACTSLKAGSNLLSLRLIRMTKFGCQKRSNMNMKLPWAMRASVMDLEKNGFNEKTSVFQAGLNSVQV